MWGYFDGRIALFVLYFLVALSLVCKRNIRRRVGQQQVNRWYRWSVGKMSRWFVNAFHVLFRNFLIHCAFPVWSRVVSSLLTPLSSASPLIAPARGSKRIVERRTHYKTFLPNMAVLQSDPWPFR